MRHHLQSIFPITVILFVAIFFSLSTPALAQERRLLNGHVPAVVTSLAPVERLPVEQRLRLAIGLPLRNQEELHSLLQQIYDPASPKYRHYLTPEQFTEQFGPTQQDYQKVIDFVKAHGLSVTATHPNRVLLDVEGSVADIEKAFHVTILVYQHPREARTFYAPDAEPSVDAGVPVLDISGLDNYTPPHPAGLRALPIDAAGDATPFAGAGPGGTYMGNDFRVAYVPGVSLNGSGQMVGLLEFDGYFSNDITAYESSNGLPNITLTNVLVTGSGVAGPHNDEVALDIDMVISMAPGLSKVIVYEGTNGTPPNSILSQMANDTNNPAKQLSSSWVWSGGTNATTDQIFLQYAAQGQSYFQASGDSGAYTGGIPTPADDPNITVVGGTTLTTSGPGGSWASEKTWNWYTTGQGTNASSGGVSTNFTIPTWQQGINMSTNQGSTTLRNIPDVAMTADNIYVIHNNGVGGSFGGTSAAAPLWAGFMALVNQQAVSSGASTVGFINPAIYAIGKGANYASDFHDIATGNNTNSSTSTKFFACPGLDLCTGWGSPNGIALINALATPDALVITPAIGFAANGRFGGPFSPTTLNLSLTNAGTNSFNWTLGNTASWLTASPGSGALTPGGAATTVTVSLNSAASNLFVGSYIANIWFTNRTSGIQQSRQFSLVVQQLVQNGGFEAGTFANWSLSGGNTNYTLVATANNLFDPHSGTYVAALGTFGSLLSLAQTLPTVIGQPYLLSLWLNSPDGAPNEFMVKWGGNTIFDQINIPAIAAPGWTNLQFVVTAAGPGTILQLVFQDESSFLGLDDISVVPVAAPVIQKVTKTNSTVTLTWNALSGLKYRLQYKTNLIQGNWTNSGSTITATNSTVTATDSSGSDKQRFYRVLLLP